MKKIEIREKKEVKHKKLTEKIEELRKNGTSLFSIYKKANKEGMDVKYPSFLQRLYGICFLTEEEIKILKKVI